MDKDGFVIAVVNNKGGVGKTTISIITAQLLAQETDILIVDCCGQQNTVSVLTDDSGRPIFEKIEVLSSAGKTPSEEKLRRYPAAIIDTPPNTESRVIRNIIDIADCVIIPFFPRKFALDGLMEIMNILKGKKKKIIAVLIRDVGKQPKTVEKYIQEIRNGDLLKGIPLIEMPKYAAVEKNINEQTDFFFGIPEKRLAPYEGLLNTIHNMRKG